MNPETHQREKGERYQHPWPSEDSETEKPTNEMAPEQHSVMIMPADLLTAAITGNSDVFVQRLGLPEEEQNLLEVKIEACHSTFLLPVDDVAVEFKLDSVTHYGDTVLHLLLAKSHNKLAFKVFESNKCLMKACNRNLETPLHYAAKVGNEEAIHELIKLDSGVIKDALRQANCKGDTALHEAAIHDHGGICCELMKLDRHMACQANKQGLSTLYIAIIEGHNSVVESMLQVDSTLVCTQFSDGMYPVLVAAKMGNQKLLFQFLEKHPKCAEFLDPRGRNIYHMAAEQEDEKLITELYYSYVHKGLINAMDYKGNTPLHVAAMEGHKGVMFALWKKMSDDCNNAPNKKGQTPFDLSVIQMKNSSDKKDISRKIDKYVNNCGKDFTPKWFENIMEHQHGNDNDNDRNIWERAQIIGLGSVLITTVTFSAAFTIPGGYNQDNGTPIFGRRYVYKAFTIANTLSFTQAFGSLFTLISTALADPDSDDLLFATDLFIAAAGCMVVAFGLGSYVILATVSKGIAILVLVWILQIASPFTSIFLKSYKSFYVELLSLEIFGINIRAFRNIVSSWSSLLFIFLVALIPNN